MRRNKEKKKINERKKKKKKNQKKKPPVNNSIDQLLSNAEQRSKANREYNTACSTATT
jgi:hypothetical protein